MDAMKITGEVRIQKWKRGELVLDRVEKNLVTTVGKGVFAAQVAGGATKITHMACGSGTNAATVGDTALGAETGRVGVSPLVSSGNVLTVVGVLLPGIGTGAINELGMFTANVAGSMTNRVKLASTVQKDADEQITITWTVTFN